MKQTFKQQEKKMILTLKNGETKWGDKNWNDTAANEMTRNGNTVTVTTVFKYGPSKTRTMTYKEFKDWRLDVYDPVSEFIL